MIKEIGTALVVSTETKTNTIVKDKELIIKVGDTGFIDSHGCMHYTTGEAKGKIQRITGLELKGYDNKNIAKLIFKELDEDLDLTDMLESYDMEKEEFTEKIQHVLENIL